MDTSTGKYKRGQYGISYPYIFPDNKMIADRIPTINTNFFTDVDGSTGNLIGNMALGLFNSYAEIGVRSYTPYRGHMYGWFIQDAGKVTPKLRLEYGVRHSIIQPYYSLWRNMVIFDPASYDKSLVPVQDPATGFILSGDLKAKYNGLVFPGDGWTDAVKGCIPIATSGEYHFMFRGLSKEYSDIHKTNFQPGRRHQPRLPVAHNHTGQGFPESGIQGMELFLREAVALSNDSRRFLCRTPGAACATRA
jgi:hypothetical protein